MSEPKEPTVVHIDSSEQHVPTEPLDKCPNCNSGPEDWDGGYGLAGGGIGVYTFCTKCGTILDKVQDHS